MKNTKIDWADMTWNPVTGCLHGCKYCYARNIANRFGGASETHCNECVGTECQWLTEGTGKIHDLNETIYDIDRGHNAPYPYEFDPTFHRYRLNEPSKIKKPQTIFVCSMADLFGDWVPVEWINEVFDACEDAPQHRYLFLTKNPGRYCDLERKGIMPHENNFWFGATFDHSNWSGEKIIGRPTTFEYNGKRIHDAGDFYFPHYPEKNRFISFEPLLYDIGGHIGGTGGDWHIIGAETGNRKGKVLCKREWVEHIVEWSDAHNVPVFMKESLRQLMGKDFIQEFPWR